MIPYIKNAIVLALSDCYIPNDYRAICNYVWEHNGTFVATTGYLAVKVELKMTTETATCPDYELEDAAYCSEHSHTIKNTTEGFAGTEYDILENFNKVVAVLDRGFESTDNVLTVNPDYLIDLIRAARTVGLLDPIVRVGGNRIEISGECEHFIFKGVLMAVVDNL